MKHAMLLLFAASVSVSLVFLAGCSDGTGPGEQPPTGVTNEELAMKYFATNDEFVRNDEATFTDLAMEPISYGTFGKVDAEITPLRFARIVTSVTRTATTTIQPGDSIAFVNVKKDISGILKIKAVTAAQETVLYEKPFNDQSERNVIFKRINRDTGKYWLNWVPVATSLVKGGTVPPNNAISITRFAFYLPDGDSIVVTNPTETYLRYRWMRMFREHELGDNHLGEKRGEVPELFGGQPVRIQVTLESASPDTDVVVLRYGIGGLNGRRAKMDLISEIQNGGTYTRVYETSRIRPLFVHYYNGFFHMGVDALTHETLFDDTAPYSSSWWGVPYRVF